MVERERERWDGRRETRRITASKIARKKTKEGREKRDDERRMEVLVTFIIHDFSGWSIGAYIYKDIRKILYIRSERPFLRIIEYRRNSVPRFSFVFAKWTYGACNTSSCKQTTRVDASQSRDIAVRPTASERCSRDGVATFCDPPWGGSST